MKLKLATILFAVSVMMTAMTSCSKENLGEAQLPPLAGEVVLTDVLATDGSRVAPNYILGVEFGTEGATKDGSGAVLEVKFVSNAPTLAAGKYTEASASVATNGNFITGEEGTKLYLNGNKYLVTAGTIDVKNNGTEYSFTAIVKLSNGENYSLKCAGVALEWTGLPVMKVLNTVMSAQSNVANGTKTVTLNLGDGNFTSEMDMTTYQTVYKGAGNYLAIDLYSEDGYLAAGTYKPSADPTNPQKGEYVIGYDTTMTWNDQVYEMKDWGTCWWTVDENATPQTSAQKITTGDITVALNGNTYTITVDNGELLAQFVGEIPAVTKPAEPADPWEISGSIVFQHEGLSYTMTDDTANNQTSGGAALEGVSLYWVQINDAAGNLVAELDLVTKAGATSLAGEYKVTSYPDEVGEAGNGFYFDLGAMGWGEGIMSGGTILYGPDGTANVVDAETSKIKITENKGQTTIIVKGTSNGATIAGKYVIGEVQEDEGGDGEGGACGCDCDGCKDCTGGGEGGDDEGGAFNGVTLAGVGGWIDYSMFGMNMLGLDFYSTGCTVTNSWWQYTYEGTGYHLKLELYCEGGVVTPGVYQITTVASAPEPNQVKAGDDTGGSEWYSVADGTATLVGKITDGTVTIEQSGDIYTVTIQSSVCNAQYVGPLAAPAQ